MKTFQFVIFFLLVSVLGALEIDINGGFEQVNPELGGKIAPSGWAVSEKLSSKSTFQISKAPGTVRSGNFGLIVETEPDGRFFFQRLDRMKFPIGQTLRFTVWAKGTGKFSMGCFCFGHPENGGPETFVRTLMTNPAVLEEVEGWTQYTLELPIVRQKAGDIWYVDLIGRVILFVHSDSEIYFDDLKVELIEKEEETPKQ